MGKTRNLQFSTDYLLLKQKSKKRGDNGNYKNKKTEKERTPACGDAVAYTIPDGVRRGRSDKLL